MLIWEIAKMQIHLLSTEQIFVSSKCNLEACTKYFSVLRMFCSGLRQYWLQLHCKTSRKLVDIYPETKLLSFI